MSDSLEELPSKPEESEEPEQQRDPGKPVQTSASIRVGFLLLGLGLMFHGFGFCAPYWHLEEAVDFGQRTTTNYGLWRWCVEEERYRSLPYDFCYTILGGVKDRDYIRATQFFETIGFLLAVASLLLLLLGICITSCRDKRILPILSAVAAVAAAGCVILGCIIFGAKDFERPYLSWAFALAIVGGIFFGLAGILIFVATLVIKR